MTVPSNHTDRSTDPKFAPRSVVSDLDNNEIRVGLVDIAAPLRLLTNLKVLSLNGNGFGNHGISALADAVDRGVLRRLEELGEWLCHRTTDRSSDPKFAPPALSDLDGNVITNVGLFHFAAPLRLLTNLKVLSLNFNEFDDQGIGRLVGLALRLAPQAADLSPLERLAMGLAPPPLVEPLSLERLLLDASWITDAGCVQLTLAIRGNLMPELRELSISGYSTREGVAQRALQEALLSLRPQPVAKDRHARMKLVLSKLKLLFLRRLYPGYNQL